MHAYYYTLPIMGYGQFADNPTNIVYWKRVKTKKGCSFSTLPVGKSIIFFDELSVGESGNRSIMSTL